VTGERPDDGPPAEGEPASAAAPASDSGFARHEHRFGTGEPFTIGLEEELLLVDPDTLQLAHVADRVLPEVGLPRERADHEAFLAEIEVRSEPRRSAAIRIPASATCAWSSRTATAAWRGRCAA
jgi:hypothetical protein